ncbi:MAG: linked oxidase domain protein [Acidimicrobiales bacterium]|nr:linked oxidase domain protein [Acidimicrobiales bacterium]
MDDLLARFREAVGEAHVLVEPDVRAGYELDWTGRFLGTTPAVVRPGSTEEVAAVVQACGAAGVALVPQGGNTGLVGGSVPLAGEVVLSLRRLNGLGPIDELAGQVTVGAGVTLAAVQAHAVASGWAVGIDLAARDSATIGGMVATNAGGLAFLRHGGMRDQLAGVEAVLGDGTVVSHLGGLRKDNTGYDLAALLCGSEGTLGVVTAVRLRLVAPVVERCTALVAVEGVAAALGAVGTLRRAGVVLEAAELFLDDGMQLVCDFLGVARPLAAAPAYLLVEWAGEVEDLGVIDAVDAVVADDAGRRESLWRYREAHTEAVNALGVPHKLDVTLPLPALAAFVADVPGAVAAVAPGSRVVLFGHVADGNIHVNVVGPPADDESVDDAVLRLVVERGGSISAEHGIGTAKKRWLHLARTEAELHAFRSIKRALDPSGILNPNVLVP